MFNSYQKCEILPHIPLLLNQEAGAHRSVSAFQIPLSKVKLRENKWFFLQVCDTSGR